MTVQSNRAPLIIHVVNSLSRGGAELLLYNTIQLLPEFNHLVVYLFEQCDLEEDFREKGIELVCLQHTNWKKLPVTIRKLRAIIRERQPTLVHSHLFYCTICTRLATPVSIPLVSTLHSIYSRDAFGKNRKSLLAARATLKKRHSLIAVSGYVLKDYLSYVPFRGKRFVLYNFIPDALFQHKKHKPPHGNIKLVAVGNLKEAKNYFYLLQILEYLEGVSLDIYGTGSLQKDLQQQIKKTGVNVRLCGSTNNVAGIFQEYDYFIQASAHEGFGLSVIEAMASGIPVILSDIPVFREITKGHAAFFPVDDAKKASVILSGIFQGEYPSAMAGKAYEFVKENYSAQQYRRKLLEIYESVTGIKFLATDGSKPAALFRSM